MFNFGKSQIVYDLHGIKIGGQPGENATVLIGTAFFGKRYSELDKEKKEEVERWIDRQEELSEVTGNPSIVDIFIDSERNVKERVDFVLDKIKKHSLFCIDTPEPAVKISTLNYVKECGVLDRAIYNSLNLGLTKDEMNVLKDCTPKAAIVLAYNPSDMSTDGRVEVLESGGNFLEDGLINIAKNIGFKCILLDTAATPFDQYAGETLRSILVMKNKWGYPVGCALRNTVESWGWLKKYKIQQKEVFDICDISCNGLAVLLGGNFCHYGPLRNVEMIFPYIAMVDKFVAEGAQDYFGVKVNERHPRRLLK